MGRMKPRVVAVALPPYGQEHAAEHDRSKGKVYLLSRGKRVGAFVRLHKSKDCTLEHCSIHRPSDHPLKDAPMIIRLDRSGLVERVCEHGIGHSDPDSVAFLQSAGVKYDGTHGCDGDCSVSGRVSNLRKETPCARCGGGPIEYHHPGHVESPNRRVSSLVAQGRPWSVVSDEIAACTALCRSCHMKADGRLEALQSSKPNQPGTRHEPKPCVVCSRPFKPLRGGMCWSCSEDHRPRSKRFKGHVRGDGCC